MLTGLGIGAVLGLVNAGVGWVRRPYHANYPIQGLAFAAISGAIVLGIPIWLVGHFLFGAL
jgi:hypothetical protein